MRPKRVNNSAQRDAARVCLLAKCGGLLPLCGRIYGGPIVADVKRVTCPRCIMRVFGAALRGDVL